MKCSVCGAEGLCWYNKARQLVCRACRDKEQLAERDARRAKLVGQEKWWIQTDRFGYGAHQRVVIEGARGGWIVVRDEAGKQHRVREHNLSDRRW